METDNIKIKQPKAQAPKKCQLESCGEEYIPKNARKKYCSSSCNAKASKLRFAENYNVTQNPMNGLSGMTAQPGIYAIPPHAIMMIDHHKAQASRWEASFDKEVGRREEAEKQVRDLKDQIAQDDNPKGALGFVQNNPELLNKAMEIFGPAIAGFLTKKMDGSTQSAIEGTNTFIQGPDSEYVRMFSMWMTKISPETQKNVWQLLTVLSHQDEEKMNYSILSLLQQWHHR